MKTFYTIKEAADLLGTSIDAIRFYEKKGLVHPRINEKNQYREYGIANILELLDIIYYRHLDMSIADISTILKESDRDVMMDLLSQKRKQSESRIRYEQQMVKKLLYIESIYEKIMKLENTCSIHSFPKSIVLSKGKQFDALIMRQLVDMSKDEFVLSSLHQMYSLSKREVEEVQILIEYDIVCEMGLMKQEVPETIYPQQDCIYRVVQMVDFEVDEKDVEAMTSYALQHRLEIGDTLYIKDVPLTSYADSNNYYAELFLPILSKIA